MGVYRCCVLWNVPPFCVNTMVELICIPNLSKSRMICSAEHRRKKKWVVSAVGVYRAAGHQRLRFPAKVLRHRTATLLPVYCCTVQWQRRRIDRVLLAGDGREAAEDGRLSLRGPDHMSRWSTWRGVVQWGGEEAGEKEGGGGGASRKGVEFHESSRGWAGWNAVQSVGCGGWFRLLAYSEPSTQLPPGCAPGGAACSQSRGKRGPGLLLHVKQPIPGRWAAFTEGLGTGALPLSGRHLQLLIHWSMVGQQIATAQRYQWQIISDVSIDIGERWQEINEPLYESESSNTASRSFGLCSIALTRSCISIFICMRWCLCGNHAFQPFLGYKKWHFRCRKLNSETTFPYKLLPKT